MTRHSISRAVLVSILAACTTEPSSEPSARELPATGPGPAEIAEAVPEQQVEEATERMPYDHVFLSAMIQHHKKELDAIEIARGRVEHPELRALAEERSTSIQAQIEKMRELRYTWYGTEGVPSALLPDEEKDDLPGVASTEATAEQLDELKTASPFDQAFLDAMIAHHQGGVAMAGSAMMDAKQKETQALAAIITREDTLAIESMQTWRDSWYPTAQAMGEPGIE